jgi:hypothetical protein
VAVGDAALAPPAPPLAAARRELTGRALPATAGAVGPPLRFGKPKWGLPNWLRMPPIWSKQLSKSEIQNYSVKKVVADPLARIKEQVTSPDPFKNMASQSSMLNSESLEEK